MNDLVQHAARYATLGHRRINHRRKYTGRAYEVHLKGVFELVKSVTDDPEMLAAAWLHDTVEDTPVTLEDIKREFGAGVGLLVEELTDISQPGDGNRAARKAVDRAHTARASPRAKTIKLADVIDNCLDITQHDPRFAKTFLAEAVALIDVLAEGHVKLHEHARKVVTNCAAQLGMRAPRWSGTTDVGAPMN
ncbi:MAG: bifunctional (p)ppGpp synthetase/guanosine-3',5'-bis(diphosphate) 3'-pyrophosphohydrolase [Deltaproteobacteria bacterium]|nr:bifunctional (p)ppGpp synthetase/guanosine-3',5'-bis(diphosphate) 3'-pyrophosphohydrolase [Deltaproteobacteria bacterium]